MNIFVLDQDIDKCAEYHVDKHVSKMILESAQMLCTNMIIDSIIGTAPRKVTSEENQTLKEYRLKWKEFPPEGRPIPYLPTMQNHPCTIWARTNIENHRWLHCYADALYSEYVYRYGNKPHKAMNTINSLSDPENMPNSLECTPFAMAMPDQLKDESDVIQSYRNFYMLDKATFAEWSHRGKPKWWDENVADYESRISR